MTRDHNSLNAASNKKQFHLRIIPVLKELCECGLSGLGIKGQVDGLVSGTSPGIGAHRSDMSLAHCKEPESESLNHESAKLKNVN